jgi:murein DD-endopeptidase MepM/ murein hydrolase activator NlpD
MTGVAAGLALAVGMVGRELWRQVGLDDVVTASADTDADLAGYPALEALDRAALDELRARKLDFPVQGVAREAIINSFRDLRGSGTRLHRALDIMAPRRSPVRAVEDGTIARLENTPVGGISIRQLDAAGRYCYYYAHLDAYADGLVEGMKVERGQLLGYVGTTGNAPRSAPHLHFAIYRIPDSKQWWAGVAVNPYAVWR